jgi:hypothetical protein
LVRGSSLIRLMTPPGSRAANDANPQHMSVSEVVQQQQAGRQ